MSVERAVPDDALLVLREIAAIVATGSKIDEATVDLWCGSPWPEVQACTMQVLVEHPYLLPPSCSVAKLDWCMDYCLERAIADERNDYVPNAYEAMAYLLAIFEICARDESRFIWQLQRFRSVLETLIVRLDDEKRDLVVTVILEHILSNDVARRLLSGWSHQPLLKTYLVEGIRMADLWDKGSGIGPISCPD